MESDTHSTLHVDNQSYSVLENTVKVVHAIQCQDVATHAICVDIDQIHELTSIVREAKQKIFTDGVVTSTAQKKKLIEEFYGAEAPQEVDVQPPEVVNAKRSGSRLPSRVEKALKLNSKPLRQCMKCQECRHHNCDKFKEKEKRRSRRNSEV
ncbi:hypothetical protein SASPL_148795 [Salvia splendens]|uniref:Uncharacterized protein n=1 Tax=Salvia splendens TaxID=180675 RepID=A0A8X8Z4F5_SALSN|nr:hypothetical protein SASPL_148795 [Salvia splendens]